VRRGLRTAVVTLALAAAPAGAGAQDAPLPPGVDSLLRRAGRLVQDGDAAAGRALADSLARALPRGSAAHAEALYTRATLALTAEDAARDYQTIVVEYPLAARAADALLRLAQVEFTRGDRPAARRHLDRLAREHATARAAVDGAVLRGRILLDDGDGPAACAAFAEATAALAPADVEARNRVAFYAQPCTSGAALAVAPRDTARPGVGPPTGPAAPPPAATPTAAARRAWSAQVAAFRTQREAEALAQRLVTRGYAARAVDGGALWRVRIGRYATRDEAAAAVRRLKAQRMDAIVVEAEPR
jgi:cell division septation protein DedD